MKKRNSTEPDLFVVNRKLSEKERKEIVDFIEAYKQKNSLKKKKLLKAA